MPSILFKTENWISWILCCGFLSLGITALQAGPVISNLKINQRAGAKVVDITYDLVATGLNTVAIRLEASNDAGATWSVPLVNVSGAVGDSVAPGNGKSIVWDAGTDWPQNYSTQMLFRLTVDDGGAPITDFSYIPPGSYTMGRTSGDTDANAPPVNVTVSGFYLQQTETTKVVWDEVRAWGLSNGYTDLGAGEGKAASHPVSSINWYDAVKWCNARSEKEGLAPCYKVAGIVMRSGVSEPICDWNASGYRLPTEAEWEKGARGSVAGKRFPWGADTINHSNANYYASSTSASYDTSGYTVYTFHPTYAVGLEPYTSSVASFAANNFGLFDVSGNVWEWCWDWYESSYYSANATDPRGPTTGTYRAVRGGSYISAPWAQTCSYRLNNRLPINGANNRGFRVARSMTYPTMSASAPTVDTRGPDISVQPQTVTVIQNSAASLSATATGTGTLAYQWQKDGVDIPGATNSTLAFQAVKPWDVGNYRVRITDSVGTVVSNVVQISLNTAQPASLWQDLLLFLPFAGQATDLSASARTVSPSNVTSGASPLGTVAGSASFNGTSSSINFTPNLPSLTEMTISFWVQTDGASGSRWIFGDWDDDAGNDLSVSLDGLKLVVGTTKNGSTMNYWSSPDIFTPNQWKHVMWIMRPDQSKIFIDGLLYQTIDATANNVGYKAYSNIGYSGYGGGQQFLSGALSSFRIYGRALSDTEAAQLYQYDAPMPEIELEQPFGTTLVDGSATTTWQALPTGGSATPVSYVIRNVGLANLVNLGLGKSGTNVTDFSLGTLAATTLAPGGSTTFTVTFAPGTGPSGARTALLQVASNDSDENPFDISLTGTAYSTTLDADSDGMNDWGEFKLSALGFDWQTPNTAQVKALYDNAGAAGLFTATQVQNLNVGMPLLQRNHSSGEFTLTIGVDKSTDLRTWTTMPMTSPQLLINGQGKLEFRFNSPDNAAFFRLKSQPTP